MNTTSTVTNTPRTYAAAEKVAEIISLEEIEAMLARDRCVTIFPKPGAHQAFNQSLVISFYHGSAEYPQFSFIGFDRQTKTGYITRATAEIRYAIFDFYNQGRIVRVVF